MLLRNEVLASLLLASLPLFAQMPNGLARLSSGRDPGLDHLILTGRAVTDDGSPVPQRIEIVAQCSGYTYSGGYTDPKGGFSFDLYSPAPAVLGTGVAQSSPFGNGSTSPDDPQDCELWARAAGYKSSRVGLWGIGSETMVNVGTVVLHSAIPGAGFMISATTAAAPKDAQKAFRKGEEEARKGKLAAAYEKFKSAVSSYPRFALAWIALGRLQIQQQNYLGAQESFQKAVDADSRVVTPYQELSLLALKQQQWQQLDANTGRLLAIDPVSYPQYWFLNAVAKYNLHQFDEAEKSVLRAITLDTKHALPETEYLLSAVLGVKKQYDGAILHLRNYIQRNPDASNIAGARKQLAELEQRVGSRVKQ